MNGDELLGSLSDIQEKYKDISQGIGLLEGELMLETDPEMAPVRLPKWRILLAWLNH